MKNQLIKISLIVMLTFKECFGLFGMGDIVSDPTSYTYYAKQIKAMNDQIKSALDQLEALNKANELINTTNDLIFKSGERIYNPATQIKNLVRNVERTQSRFQNMAERVKNMGAERFFKDYHNIEKPLEAKAYDKWKDNLSALFNNDEDEKYQELRKEILAAQKRKDYLRYQKAVDNMGTYLELKKKEQVGIKRSSLRAPIELFQQYFLNDDVVKQRIERQEEIDDLLIQIHSSEDLLKQQQTTNQILMKMLETIDQQYEMQMRVFYALSIPQFHNTATSIDEELKNLNDEREKFNNANSIKKTPAIEEREKFLKKLADKGKDSETYKILSGEQEFHEF